LISNFRHASVGITAQKNAERRAVEQLRKRATVRIIRDGEVMLGNVAQANAVSA